MELANYNYFINLYDQNKKLLQRLMLRDEIVSPNETLKVTFSLTDSNVYSLTILSISKDNYPAYVATADENNMATLTCTKDYEKVDYLLNNNKVYAISLLYEVGVDDANFNTLYGTYQAMQVSYNSIEGVSSSIETINNVLNFAVSGILTSNSGIFLEFCCRDGEYRVIIFLYGGFDLQDFL